MLVQSVADARCKKRERETPEESFPARRVYTLRQSYQSPRAINLQCFREYNEKRCKGMVVSAPVEGWSECPKCSATGREGGAKCVRCGGCELSRSFQQFGSWLITMGRAA